MTWSGKYPLVFAIYLNSRGFAFVLFEGPLAPLDWGTVEARGDKREKIISRISSLSARYTPHVVVLQDMSPKGTHRPHRIRHLNEAIAKIAVRFALPTAFVSRSQVRQYFAYLGSVSKDAIAAAIAKHIPAFERFLPLPRKPWKSEDARMGIFDAAALALTFFQMDGLDSSDEVPGAPFLQLYDVSVGPDDLRPIAAV
jgi:hypothetical protein